MIRCARSIPRRDALGWLPLLVLIFAAQGGGLLAQGERAADDWPMWRGDLKNTGRSPSPTDAVKGERVWSFLAGNRVTVTPCFRKGVMYFGDWGGSAYALDHRTGKLLWSTTERVSKHPRPKKKKEKAPSDLAPTLDGVPKKADQVYSFSNPCVDDAHLYIATQQGILTAFNVGDGSVAWEREFEDELFSSPRLAEGKLLIGCNDRNLYCLDPATGKTIWKFETGDYVGSSAAVTRGGQVIFPAHDKFLRKVDLDTGKLIAAFEIGYRSTGSPAIAFGSAYFCATGRKFMSVDLLRGNVRWHQPCTAQHQQGIGVWKRQVMVVINRMLFCFDAITGQEKWRYNMEKPGVASPCVGRELVYVSNGDGRVFAIKLETGELAWQANYGASSWSSPVLVDGLVYICDGKGRVSAFR